MIDEAMRSPAPRRSSRHRGVAIGGVARIFHTLRAVAGAALCALVASLAVAPALGAEGDFTPVPELRAHVTDLTSTLSAADKAALEQKLAAWEGQKGGQFAVLMVPTTKPDTIDQYSQRVTDQWRIGRKNVDDGVLLLIAKDDKKLRIQVGKGFEGALTDVTAKRIIEEEIVPLFRRGDFTGGVNAGVDKVISVVAGEALPPPKASAKSGSSHSTGWFADWIGFILFAGLGLFWFAASLLNRLFGRVGGSLVGGAVAGGIGWMVTSLIAVAAGAGIVTFILLLIALAARGAGVGSGHRGGWIGGLPGGFGGGSSGGGGSWSGGGGDFGGGGASGSWGDS